MEAGMFASFSEWVRHAIREQLQREQSPFEKLVEQDPRVLESLAQLERNEVTDVDIEIWRKRAGLS